MKVNGFANEITNNVYLWIVSDRERHNIVKSMFDFPYSEDFINIAYAGILQEWFEDQAPVVGNNIFSELLDQAIAQIDWYEIAETLNK